MVPCRILNVKVLKQTKETTMVTTGSLKSPDPTLLQPLPVLSSLPLCWHRAWPGFKVWFFRAFYRFDGLGVEVWVQSSLRRDITSNKERWTISEHLRWTPKLQPAEFQSWGNPKARKHSALIPSSTPYGMP